MGMAASGRTAGRVRQGWSGRRTGTRTAAALAVLGLGIVGLAGCSPHRPTPKADADALAAALTSGDFSHVALAAGAPDAAALTAARTAAFAGLDGAIPTVSVTSVSVDPKESTKATAGLHWEWDLGTAKPWTYDVTTQAGPGRGQRDVGVEGALAHLPARARPRRRRGADRAAGGGRARHGARGQRRPDHHEAAGVAGRHRQDPRGRVGPGRRRPSAGHGPRHGPRGVRRAGGGGRPQGVRRGNHRAAGRRDVRHRRAAQGSQASTP